MRQVLPGLAAALLLLGARTAGAQQGSIQISASAQAITGAPERVAAQPRLEPDLGLTWLQPRSRFGIFQLEVRGARRDDKLHAGRLSAAVRELELGGLTWAVEAGDTHFSPAIGDYKFSNLFTPAVTFNGVAVTARNAQSSVSVMAGQTTARRNIFGTDPETLGQSIGSVRASHRVNERLELTARASRVRTTDLQEFRYAIASSDQAGGGARLWITPSIQAAADASVVSYRRYGSDVRERDVSTMVGASWLHPKGWLQVNASRFSPGDFPVINTPLPDREGLFVAGDYDIASRLRVFAGWELFRSNLLPDAALRAALPPPQASGSREFGGVRLRLTSRSTLTLRAEHGARVSRPLRTGIGSDSDTGSWSAEWQALTGPFTTFTRYARRSNVDHISGISSSTQHDVSAQIFATPARGVQLFASALGTRNELAAGGSSYWQVGGGGQLQLPVQNLWFRGEFTASRNVDLLSARYVPRESLNIGVNGQLSSSTSVAFNVAVDRAPVLSRTGNPWLTRSTLRVTRSITTGSSHLRNAGGGSESSAARGTGSVMGSVYADWNGNGVYDTTDQLLEGIPVRIGAGQVTTTGRDGEFVFVNVASGVRDVGVDTGSLPVDYDPPAIPHVELELARGSSRRVSFGLVPLGTIQGRVVRDVNANGQVDAGDTPVDGAVLVLDGGVRSEQAREGRFRFDAVRNGERAVKLLLESLPEGAVIAGDAEVRAVLRRDRMIVEIPFLVSIEQRPEIRRVFPPKGGAARPAVRPGRGGAAAPRPSVAPRTPPVRRPASTPAAWQFAVQVAALHDPTAVVNLVNALEAAGFAVYVSHPGPSDPSPYRVRVGPFRTRAEADRAVAELEKRRAEKLWVVRER